MSGAAGDLRRVQQWMQAVITHPAGVEEGSASAEATGAIDGGPNAIERVILPSRALSSQERLAIYHRAYFARLLECLHDDFPTLLGFLGGEVFDGLAIEYLIGHPSRSYTLNRLGERFVEFLEATRPRGAQDDWADFLIDLARLDWTFGEVFDGPGLEDHPPFDPEPLGQLMPDQWERARLVPARCLRLVAFRYPVNDYYTQLRSGQRPSIPEPVPTWLAVTRRDYVVRRHPLSHPQFELLGGIAQGLTVGAVIVRVATLANGGSDEWAGSLRQWFFDWGRDGFFEGIELPA